MDSYHNVGVHDDGNNQRLRASLGTGRKPARHQHYTPPKAMSEYVQRALPLPPRPTSSSSSVYTSHGEDAQQQPTPKHQLSLGQHNDNRSTMSFAGAIDEEALALVRPPQSSADTLQPQQQQGIDSPQPGHSANTVLQLKTRDEYGVSPVSAAWSGVDSHNQYVVSPLTPDGSGSEYSCDVTISEPDHISDTNSNSWARSSTASNQMSRRHSLHWNDSTTQPSRNMKAMTVQPELLHSQIQKFNLRHSDPGSPTKGVAAGSFGSRDQGPDVERALRSNNAQGRPAGRNTQSVYGYPVDNHSKAKVASPSGSKISFAAAKNDSFSTRPTAKKHHPVPAPLKLKDRPLADNYVKTPFPPSRKSSDISQKSVFEDDESLKKHKRVSSFTDFARSLRSVPNPSSEGLSAKQNDARHAEVPSSRASPVPKVKNILSRAKHGLGHGLGLIADEVRKEKRREDLKRQIRVGTPVESSRS